MKLAAVTMVYNEPDYLGLWCHHYGREVGAANCFVIDHGSEDGTLDGRIAATLIRFGRSGGTEDETWRADILSRFCSSLLERYDAVIYTDVDEILVADPRHHRSLADCAGAMTGPVLQAYGFEFFHMPQDEAAIDLAAPITRQRRWLWFNSGVCKAAIIRAPVRWAAGLHCTEEVPAFGQLYLFHLRYFDRGRGLARLARTRTNLHQSAHARIADAPWLNILEGMGRLVPEEIDLDPASAALREPMDRLLASQQGREQERYRFALNVHGRRRIALPARFVGRF